MKEHLLAVEREEGLVRPPCPSARMANTKMLEMATLMDKSNKWNVMEMGLTLNLDVPLSAQFCLG